MIKMENKKVKGDLWRAGETTSLPKQLHHPPVVLRLLRELLRLGHLHHLPQQVEGQIQRYWRLFGPPPPLHGLVPAVSQVSYERPDVANFALQETPRQLELQRSVKDGRGSPGIHGRRRGKIVRVPVAKSDEILLSEPLQYGTGLLLGVLALWCGDARGTAGALNSPTFEAGQEGNKQNHGGSEQIELHVRISTGILIVSEEVQISCLYCQVLVESLPPQLR